MFLKYQAKYKEVIKPIKVKSKTKSIENLSTMKAIPKGGAMENSEICGSFIVAYIQLCKNRIKYKSIELPLSQKFPSFLK